MEQFQNSWAELDHDRSNLIPTTSLPTLVFKLGDPLGVDEEKATFDDVVAYIESAEIPLHESEGVSCVTYAEVLRNLAATQEAPNEDFDDEKAKAWIQKADK